MPIERRRRTDSSASASAGQGNPLKIILIFLGASAAGAMVFVGFVLWIFLAAPDESSGSAGASGGRKSRLQSSQSSGSSDTTRYERSVGLVLGSFVFEGASSRIEVPMMFRGSSFVVSSDGYMLTNYHVVKQYLQDREKVKTQFGDKLASPLVVGDETYTRIFTTLIVVMEEHQLEAEVVDRVFSDDMDFALLKLNDPGSHPVGIVPIPIHPNVVSGEPLIEQLEPIYALGFPAAADVFDDSRKENRAAFPESVDDLVNWIKDQRKTVDILSENAGEYSITSGRVSRVVDSNSMNYEYITHDALIAGGSSGGPLLDKNGFVIGINTAFARGGNGEVAGYKANSMRSIYPKISRYVSVE